MKKLFRFLKYLLIFLVVASIGLFAWLKSKTPNYNQELNLPGLKAPVEVLYDDYGIPHIFAQNEEDLLYAFGYVHAQDRLFQMEMIRRLADGRLAELFGDKALQSDKFFKTLSFRKQAEMTIDSLYRKNPDAPFVKATEAYLKGVNHYIKNGDTPLEFIIAGIPKTEMTIADVEIITGYMGYTFVHAFRAEAISTFIHSQLGADYWSDVMSAWPDSLHKIPVQANEPLAKASNTLAFMANQLTAMQSEFPCPPYHGSNGWVVAGSKTKSGKPILSNDTHIAYSQPSVWYEAHLQCPTLEIYGNFLAGTPMPALGHTPYGGWGLTMFENDDADFFREKINPQNSSQVWYKDHWEDLTVRNENIKVKGQKDVIYQVKKSRHGYILNEAFDGVKNEKDPIALWWVWHQFPSRHLETFYKLAKAHNATQAGEAVSHLTSPGLNVMWADVEGNIGWWAAGKIPKRPAHVNPALILDGSTGKDDPQGWLPFSQNPQIVNPAKGVLYTANNQPADMGSGLVAGYYVPANRAERIEQLIFNDRKDWTEPELRKVISDITSPSYPRILKGIMPIVNQRDLSATAKDMAKRLENWDGSHNLADVEPTIFYRFLYHTLQNALEDEIGHEHFKAFEHELSLKRNLNVWMLNDKSRWWDNVKTPKKETRAEIFTEALNQAANDLQDQLGSNIEKWQWSRVHTITHKHPLGILPVIGSWFNVGPIPVPGGRETINNLDFSMDSTGTYNVTYGPALRRIIDFGDAQHGTSVNPTGQSGYLMSKHYQDQAHLFAESKARPELMNRKDIEKVMIGKTVFK
jgi:penicillin G amidase